MLIAIDHWLHQENRAHCSRRGLQLILVSVVSSKMLSDIFTKLSSVTSLSGLFLPSCCCCSRAVASNTGFRGIGGAVFALSGRLLCVLVISSSDVSKWPLFQVSPWDLDWFVGFETLVLGGSRGLDIGLNFLGPRTQSELPSEENGLDLRWLLRIYPTSGGFTVDFTGTPFIIIQVRNRGTMANDR